MQAKLLDAGVTVGDGSCEITQLTTLQQGPVTGGQVRLVHFKLWVAEDGRWIQDWVTAGHKISGHEKTQTNQVRREKSASLWQ